MALKNRTMRVFTGNGNGYKGIVRQAETSRHGADATSNSPEKRGCVTVSFSGGRTISIRGSVKALENSHEIVKNLTAIRKVLVETENPQVKTILENGLQKIETVSDVSSLLKIAHLLRSPKDAARLLSTLSRAGTATPKVLEEVQQERSTQEVFLKYRAGSQTIMTHQERQAFLADSEYGRLLGLKNLASKDKR